MAMNSMSASGLMSMSTVSFPASESESEATSLPAAHLPFRRISLPAKPSQSGTPFRHSQSGSPFRQSQSGAPFRQSGVNVRDSVASFASFGSVGAALGSAGAASLSTEAVSEPSGTAGGSARPMGAAGSADVFVETGSSAESGRRCAVVRELYATEKTYVEGLDLIYTHFLTPLVASLSTSSPLVTPAQLTSIFGNFIDVWNLHRTFFAALDAHLGTNGLGSRALSSVLLAHFPYLSLYTPFVTRFSDALGTLYAASKNGSGLAAFVARQEADPRCGKLRLGDWLLTIVQRCPRYLLLLRDLLACIPPHDPDRRGLEAAYALVEKTTTSLNTSLHAHAHTLALVALQRSTAHLPPDLDFVAPARALLRRGPLRYHGSATRDSWYGDTAPRTAEFLLFTDSLVWIEPEGHERWVYKGHIDLVDIEVVLGIHTRREAKIEIRSPGGSFAMFAPQEADRYSDDRDRDDIDDNAAVHHLQTWAHALRAAKSARLALLAAAPDSTLTSSASTNHLRRALRALPYPWEGEETGECGDVEEGRDGESYPWDGQIADAEGRSSYKLQGKNGVEEYGNGYGAYDSEGYEHDSPQPHPRTPSASPRSHAYTASPRPHSHPSPLQLSPSPSPSPLSRPILLPTHPQASPSQPLTHVPNPSHRKPHRTPREPPRAPLTHFLPPLWVPDADAPACMRCARPFGWGLGRNEGGLGRNGGGGGNDGKERRVQGGQGRIWLRRRHHCRLCGRCVCAECSGKTFYISDTPNTTQNPGPAAAAASNYKPARACDECYEAAFPVVRAPPRDRDRPTGVPHDASPGVSRNVGYSSGAPYRHSAPVGSAPIPLSTPAISTTQSDLAESIPSPPLRPQPQPESAPEQEPLPLHPLFSSSLPWFSSSLALFSVFSSSGGLGSSGGESRAASASALALASVSPSEVPSAPTQPSSAPASAPTHSLLAHVSASTSAPPAPPVFPAWLSMPARPGSASPEALMAMTVKAKAKAGDKARDKVKAKTRKGKERMNEGEDSEEATIKVKAKSANGVHPDTLAPPGNTKDEGTVRPASLSVHIPVPLSIPTSPVPIPAPPSPVPIRIRLTRPRTRPRSYYEIVEDFRERERDSIGGSSVGSELEEHPSDGHARDRSAASSLGSGAFSVSSSIPESDEYEYDDSEGRQFQSLELDDTQELDRGAVPYTHLSPHSPHTRVSPHTHLSPHTPPHAHLRERLTENTARRVRRFSLPAIALQTTPVFARPELRGAVGGGKRFSLVLGDGVGYGRISVGEHEQEAGAEHGRTDGAQPGYVDEETESENGTAGVSVGVELEANSGTNSGGKDRNGNGDQDSAYDGSGPGDGIMEGGSGGDGGGAVGGTADDGGTTDNDIQSKKDGDTQSKNLKDNGRDRARPGDSEFPGTKNRDKEPRRKRDRDGEPRSKKDRLGGAATSALLQLLRGKRREH